MSARAVSASRVVLWVLLCLLAGRVVAVGQVTYYVRPDGGTVNECTGLTDAAYPGSGTAQACAWDHPFRALPPGGAALISGGDTLIIGAGSYKMGVGAPGADLCDPAFPWDCHTPPVPSGPPGTAPTRILGAGWNSGCASPPELWGTERADPLIDLTGSSNVEIACLELTDHAGCVEFHAKASLRCERDVPPFGDWAPTGIYAQDAASVTLRDLDIHGLAHTGIQAGRLADWTVEDVRLAANGWAGWDGNITGSDSNSGTLTFRRWTVEWNGCGETWPASNPSGCWSQSAGGYGDGVGTGPTGGQWVIEDSSFLHNTADGLDLFSVQPGASITIRRTIAAGNAGNQIKTSGPATIENSIVVGNCASFDGQPFTFSVDNCSAQGSAVSLHVAKGDQVLLTNSTLTGEGDCLVLATCMVNADPSTGVVLRNNIFQGQSIFVQPSESTCLTSANLCAVDPFDVDYSVIENVKNGACPGANDVCGGSSGLKNDRIDKFDAHLTASSPAVDSGLSVGGTVPADDFDGLSRPYRGGVDRGAYETRLVPDHSERVCRKEVRKRLSVYVKSVMNAMRRCLDDVNDGSVPPPCPDAIAAEKLARAAAKLDPQRLERRCPAQVLATMSFAAPCSLVSDGASLATCILTSGTAVVNAMMAVEYSVTDAVLATKEEQVCQENIAKRVGIRYALKRLRLLTRCWNRQDKGKVPSCPDAASVGRISRAAARAADALASKCSDAVIQSLQSAGGFGGTCASALTVSDLTACQIADHDTQIDQVLAILP